MSLLDDDDDDDDDGPVDGNAWEWNGIVYPMQRHVERNDRKLIISSSLNFLLHSTPSTSTSTSTMADSTPTQYPVQTDFAPLKNDMMIRAARGIVISISLPSLQSLTQHSLTNQFINPLSSSLQARRQSVLQHGVRFPSHPIPQHTHLTRAGPSLDPSQQESRHV